MHVMAGVMLDAQGRVLLAQRPPGKHLAGLWEFPGGKLEEGELPAAGLARELHEELGVQVTTPGDSLIRIPWRYGDRLLLLDAWVLRHWQGEPVSLEGQALQWCELDAIDLAMLAPADRPILRALQLPERYPITPADVAPESFDAWRERLVRALRAGERLILLRFPRWPLERVRELADTLLPLARRQGAQLMLSGDVDGARELGRGVGVQLKARQLMALESRPLPWDQCVGASCHDADELVHARAVADFATLSPVAATATHPDQVPLGWDAFRRMVDAAALPIYALGGMRDQDMATARQGGAQGVSGIRGFW
ncbi:Nudix family hydrolase [Dyella jiangningensis]|uniref:8-oxo-dGTP diphosphatase n=1 Tax=Dyella jiangningensis TaxID=1379159 RepID=A0A328P5S9_9GAMM|nr:Nudix family hydrolase [Dyella jiangningensis]RAO75965.1 thiamine monophosphate synthase [Dyella jiangningensis]